MNIGTGINYFKKAIGLERAAKLLSEAGFKLLDYTPKTEEEKFAARDIFKNYGLSVYQTHAPFNRYSRIPTEEHKKSVFDTLNTSAGFGAEYMVVHGDEFDFDAMEYTPEAALMYNYDYFAPVVEEATKLGVKVAFENVFEDIKGKPRFCSKAEDLAALIDKFNSNTVCACWDTGHAAVSFKDLQPEAIEILGSRIECTHIHDNYLNSDSHLIPFTGKIDWQKCISALKKNTKTEVLSLEFVYGTIPEGLAEIYAKFIFQNVVELSKIQ